MTNTIDILGKQFGSGFRADAAVFTHMHSDHCSAYPLKVLAKSSTPVFVHAACCQQFRSLHCDNKLLNSMKCAEFDSKGIEAGHFHVEPFNVSHSPAFPTFGFNIYHKSNSGIKRISIVTDFYLPSEVLEHIIDSDLIYIESNHDTELLRQFPNPNSRYHCPNHKTAQLVCEAVKNSPKPPKNIVLGHLSHKRNTHELAYSKCAQALEQKQLFETVVSCAPQFSPSPVFTVD